MCKLLFGFVALIAATQSLQAQGVFPTNEVCGRLEELGLSHEACEDPMLGPVSTPPAVPVAPPKRVAKRKRCCDPDGKPCKSTGPCESAR